jgi:hypothetical protein
MSIPSHAFELLVYMRSGQMQTREFQTLGAAVEAAHGLRPSLVLGWRLSLVMESFSFPRERRRVDAEAFKNGEKVQS